MKPTRRYELYVDGASRGNPGPAGIGVVVQDGANRSVRQFSKSVGETTNNVAEYLALIYALQEALRAGYTAVTVKSDSELLVRQFNGQYKVRDAQLRVLHDVAAHLAQGFAHCRVEHVPREQNRLADRLAGQAAKKQSDYTDRGGGTLINCRLHR